MASTVTFVLYLFLQIGQTSLAPKAPNQTLSYQRIDPAVLRLRAGCGLWGIGCREQVLKSIGLE